MDTNLFPEDIMHYYSDEERQDDARDLSLLLDYGSIFRPVYASPTAISAPPHSPHPRHPRLRSLCLPAFQ
jgi:hypothetical protein